MQKSKLFALAISVISTGILVSCVKPTTSDSNDTNQNDTAHATVQKNQQETIQKNTQKNTQTSTQETSNESADKTVDEMNQSEGHAVEDSVVQAVKIDEKKATAYLNHVASDIIIPTYKASLAESDNLHQQVVTLCKEGSVSSEHMVQLHEQWLKLATAWAKAEAINFGTATANMNNLYINYFPDERGLVHRSVNQLIKDSPEIDASSFIDQSAIVQGVPALEDVLYSNDGLDAAQCHYVLSASTELSRRLSLIVEDWQNKTADLLNSQNPSVGMNQWHNSLLSLVETLKSTGLEQPLGLNKKAKGHLPAHLAGQSRSVIQAKLTILKISLSDPELQKLFAVEDSNESKAESKAKDTAPDIQSIINDITNTISTTEQHLSQLPEDIAKAQTSDQQKLYDSLSDMTKQIKRKLMPVMGVQVGFNSTDGD